MTQREAALIPLAVPELGTGPIPVTVSLWLVPRGAVVLAGDRVVELVAGGITVDLEAPVSGRLVSQLADEDEEVAAGRVVAEFEAAA
jgi:pyruvate/2-oxoglutarate dehydrogenase complex dihydrolipoamide acyltransferase (E2) component